jgi:quercetin dioxygenase-like cupin family protein
MPNAPGKTLTAITVEYAPGGKSGPHRHAGSGFIFAYVLEGEIRSALEGEAPRVYKAGESWTEPPAAHHVVSENASASKPAKLLAIIVADTGDTLTTFDK